MAADAAGTDCGPATTAFAVEGPVAAVALTTQWAALGPHGESHQAFVLFTTNRGATWRELPLLRTVAERIWHWGFPVWPPQRIHAIALRNRRLSITFADEWVMFEPGGESLWHASRGLLGLWCVRRIRKMDYDGLDAPFDRPVVTLELPPHFQPPPPRLLERIAVRIAMEKRFVLPMWAVTSVLCAVAFGSLALGIDLSFWQFLLGGGGVNAVCYILLDRLWVLLAVWRTAVAAREP